jgi:hypothetical protein
LTVPPLFAESDAETDCFDAADCFDSAFGLSEATWRAGALAIAIDIANAWAKEHTRIVVVIGASQLLL